MGDFLKLSTGQKYRLPGAQGCQLRPLDERRRARQETRAAARTQELTRMSTSQPARSSPPSLFLAERTGRWPGSTGQRLRRDHSLETGRRRAGDRRTTMRSVRMQATERLLSVHEEHARSVMLKANGRCSTDALNGRFDSPHERTKLEEIEGVASFPTSCQAKRVE